MRRLTVLGLRHLLVIISYEQPNNQFVHMPELDLWPKNADATSFYEGLSEAKAQALNGYLDGESPKEVARSN